MSQLRAQAEASSGAHEEQTDFAMTAARIGVSYRDLGSSWVVVSPSLARLLGLPPDVARHLAGRALRADPSRRSRPRARDGREGGSRACPTSRWRSGWSCPTAWCAGFSSTAASRSTITERRRASSACIADITDRRSLELQLRQAQKMEARRPARRRRGARLQQPADRHHRLRAALRSSARASREQRHDIEEIVKAAGRAAALTKQLLSFSRRHVMETVVDRSESADRGHGRRCCAG